MSFRTDHHRSLLSLILLAFLCCLPVHSALAESSSSSDSVKEAKNPTDSGTAESTRPGFADAVRDGAFRLGLRYRFEHVDDEAFNETAHASTLRTTMSYRTGDWRGWSLFLEAEDVSPIFDDDDYANAGRNGRSNGVQGLPVIADPEGTAVGQAYVRWADGEQAGRPRISLGRQEINLGDQRFVGAVGWRQHHQTFDAARIEWKPGRLAVDYTLASKVNRIFGDSQALTGHFLQLAFEPRSGHQLTAYGFALDFDDLVALSTSTFGLEAKGKLLSSSRFPLRYELEAAQQSDSGDNPFQVDTDYRHASLGTDLGPARLDLAWEVLGGAGTGDRAFATPLATLHKWNGWADKFLRTPAAGLETASFRLRSGAGKDLSWTVTYLQFGADDDGRDFGSEVDAEVVYKAPWGQTIAIKAAQFMADDLFEDTRKVMVWTSTTF